MPSAIIIYDIMVSVDKVVLLSILRLVSGIFCSGKFECRYLYPQANNLSDRALVMGVIVRYSDGIPVAPSWNSTQGLGCLISISPLRIVSVFFLESRADTLGIPTPLSHSHNLFAMYGGYRLHLFWRVWDVAVRVSSIASFVWRPLRCGFSRTTHTPKLQVGLLSCATSGSSVRLCRFEVLTT